MARGGDVSAAAFAPADAFYDIAAWLGDEAMMAPWPDLGARLKVIGRDGVETQWHLDRLTASRLVEWIHDQPGLACIAYCRYDTRAQTP